MNLGNSLRRNAIKQPDKVAIISKGEQITFKELDQRANRLANAFIDMGLKQGDNVAILLYNCAEYLEILFGLAKAGVTGVPVNFRFVEREVVYILNNSDSKALIYGEEFENLVKAVKEGNGCPQIPKDAYFYMGTSSIGTTSYKDLLADSSTLEPSVKVDSSTILFIGYTSGTTGFPKGAMRSHRTLINLILTTGVEWGLTEKDRSLANMPMFHFNSIIYSLTLLFLGGSVFVYHWQSFDAERVLSIINDYQITFASFVPTMYTLMLNLPEETKKKYDMHSLNVLLSSSSPLLTVTKMGIAEYFKVPFYEVYGGTEMGPATTLKPADTMRKIRCVGRAFLGTDVKLLNLNGKECKPGEVGELYARGLSVFDGYYNMPEATEKAFKGDWFSGGDMAVMDEEGFYYLLDRKNDMIISGGENIYPSEIEEVIIKYPSVDEVAVIGVPDEKWGEAVKAVITVKVGLNISVPELITFCRANLAGYKVPKSVDIVDELPKNPTGKILKRVIREKCWEGQERSI